jgi:hypothetical protein
MKPNHPIYIISKGRWDSRFTAKALDKINVPYRIVVEPQEFDQYAAVIPPEKIIVLPFSNLGQASIPARNFVLEHSIAEGAAFHWILDDNIRAFRRYNNDKKYLVTSGTIFKCAEDFVERYTNVGLAGFQYSSFMAYNRQKRPFTLNCRIYSCILINNAIGLKWEGRYNEDSDLSIRCLKKGLCTILFNAFLQDKVATMTMKGGNTDTLYNTGDNRLEFAESLKRKHPDCVEVIWRFKRWHHLIQYNKINRPALIRKEGLDIQPGINEYGMVLTKPE